MPAPFPLFVHACRRASASARALCVAGALATAGAAASPLTDEVAHVAMYVRMHPGRALERLQALDQEARLAPAAERGEYMTQLGYAQLHGGMLADAMATAKRLQRLAGAAAEPPLRIKGMLLEANVLAGENRRPEAHELLWQAHRDALATPDVKLRLQAAILAGQAYAEAGRQQDALPILFGALDLARQRGMHEQTIFALQTLADLYEDLGDYDRGLAAVDEALAMAREARNDGQLSALRITEYGLASSKGDNRRAIGALRSALAWARTHEVDEVAALACANLSSTYLETNNPDAAYRYAGEALRLAALMGDERVASFARMNRGHAALMLGRIQEGKTYLERAIDYTLRSGDMPQVVKDLDQYSDALELAKDTAGALKVARRARELSDKLDSDVRARAVAEVQGKYEAGKRQARLDALERENRARADELASQRRRVAWSIVFAATALSAALLMAVLLRRLRRAHDALHQLSVRDPLTKLYNRRHFQHIMAQARARERTRRGRTPDTVGLLLVLDVDHFKRVNDTYGHAAGDAVLQAVAQTLRQVLRETDMIVRWGGEEFLAYMEAVLPDTVEMVARRILAGVAAATVTYQGIEIGVTVSVGFAQLPQQDVGVPLERIVALADQALYLAKHGGRNRACGLRRLDALDHASVERIERHLEQAAREGEVELVTITS